MGHRDIHPAFPENLRDPVDAEAAAMRLQDLFLVLSQCIDLGLLAVAAALGSARDLKKILGSGFEMIRISQGESPRVCGFMIKKGQSGDQIQDQNRGELWHHPEASPGGILFPVRDSLGDTGSLLMAAPRKSFAGPGAKVSGPGPYSTP
jgi:hypothetical protein